MGPLEACKETQNTEAARSKTTVIIGLLKRNNEAHGGLSDAYVLFLERLRPRTFWLKFRHSINCFDVSL